MLSFVRFGLLAIAAVVPPPVAAPLPTTIPVDIIRLETPATISEIVRTSDAIFFVEHLAGTGDARLMIQPDGAPLRVLLDPAALGKRLGPVARWSITNVVPSTDGRHVAVGLVPDGAQDETHTRFVETASGTVLPDDLPRSKSGVTAWSLDGTTAFCSQAPALAPGLQTDRSARAIVYRHQLGSTDADTPAFGIGVDPNVPMGPGDAPRLVMPPGSTYAVGVVAHRERSELTLYSAPVAAVLAGGQIPWRKFADVDDGAMSFDMRGSTAYLLKRDAAGRYGVTALDLSDDTGLAADATLIAPAGAGAIDQIAVARDALYLRGRAGGGALIRKVVWNDDGSPGAIVDIPLPAAATVSEFATDPDHDGAIVEFSDPADTLQVDAIDASGALHASGILGPGTPQPSTP